MFVDVTVAAGKPGCEVPQVTIQRYRQYVVVAQVPNGVQGESIVLGVDMPPFARCVVWLGLVRFCWHSSWDGFPHFDGNE